MNHKAYLDYYIQRQKKTRLRTPEKARMYKLEQLIKESK